MLSLSPFFYVHLSDIQELTLIITHLPISFNSNLSLHLFSFFLNSTTNIFLIKFLGIDSYQFLATIPLLGLPQISCQFIHSVLFFLFFFFVGNFEMENENWNCSNFSMEIPTSELNCSSEQLSNCFFNPNWENSMDQNDPFESALSSMVSSPAASNAAIHGGVGGGGDNVVLRELIGRLGSICNSGEISPHSYIGKSAETSCYSTPLNSPPKLNLSMMDQQQQIRGNFTPFSADPGFAERAARYSCFGGSKNYGGPNAQFGQNETEFPSRSTTPLLNESGKLSRASSFQSRTKFQETKDGNSVSNMKFNRLSSGCSTPETAEFGDSREESSVSEQISGGGVELGLKAHNDGNGNGNGRKRKAIPKGKARDIPPSPSPSATKDATKAVPENGETNAAKRSKSEEGTGNEKDDAAAAKAKAEPKVAEPLKDYIHVRARRGQATDSHSLAERVRREKISERMKFLQDLVPGCNKVTGKAVMLDEIINYVQSLQRQVEFLSMKLSTVNPRMEFNAEALLSKDVFQSRATLPPAIFPVDSSASAFPYQYHQSQGGLSVQSAISNGTETPFSINPLNAALRRGQGMPQLSSIDGFGEASPQVLAFWEDDLHSVVQMGFGQNQPECFNGSMAAAQMKIEL